jgi:hypothetical protein
MSSFIIPLVIYPFDLLVSIGQSDIQLTKTIEKNYNESFSEKDLEILQGYTALGSARSLRLSSGLFILRMKQIPSTADDFGLLHHELFHIVTRFMEMIGSAFDCNTSGENYAYLIQYLTTTIYKKIRVV